MELILVRHAENVLFDNKQKITSELLNNTPLTKSGENQSIELSHNIKYMPNVEKTVIFSSPALRCISTAEYISKSLNIEIIKDEHLKDRMIGNLLFDNIDNYRKWQLESWYSHQTSDNGSESLIEMKKRVKSWLIKLRKLNVDRVIVITHGSVIECVTSLFLKIPLKSMVDSFIQCDHAKYHLWSLNFDHKKNILIKSNFSGDSAQPPSKENFEKISNRLEDAKHGKIFVIDKYYVR